MYNLFITLMAYKALYRTYRPQTFDEVAGQKHIVRTLKNALEKNKIAHAYLFCGPRGTGKTTMAKLFAKALNCEEGQGHQCNKCDNCIEITEGTHPDVIEIDAASNNGVEQVRDLIDKVNYLPLKGRYKVYIIDEVHMMTTNAFNALLKTLEEPPAHVVFILATTEPHNIIPTILSRCQRYDFTKVSDIDIKERMITILNKEGITYEDGAVSAIISLADGGMRDALSILDQILAYSNDSLTENDVYTLYGLASIDQKVNLIKDVYNGDVTMTLSRINAFSEAGVDLKRLNTDLLEILKDVLIYKKVHDEEELTQINEEVASELNNLIDIKTLNIMISAFLKNQIDFKSVSNIKTLFEITLLKLATLKDEIIESQKPQKNEDEKKTVPVKSETKKDEPFIDNKTPNVSHNEIKKSAKEETKTGESPKKIEKAPDWLLDNESTEVTVETSGEQYSLDDETIIKLMVLGDKEGRKSLINRWDELNSYLGHPQLGDVVALIKDGRPFIVTKDVIVMEYDFDKLSKKANIKTNQDNISKIMSQMIGRNVFVYALPRSEAIRLITAFHNLRQISQLPKPSEINIEIGEIKK